MNAIDNINVENKKTVLFSLIVENVFDNFKWPFIFTIFNILMNCRDFLAWGMAFRKNKKQNGFPFSFFFLSAFARKI